MPDTKKDTALKEQVAQLLQPFAGNSDMPALLSKIDKKQLTALLEGLANDIQNEIWASTGKQQIIAAQININIVGKDV